LIALADPRGDLLDRLSPRAPIGDLNTIILGQVTRTDRPASMKVTRPASMNQSDPQLNDTATS
jgi:hypothetical protein